LLLPDGATPYVATPQVGKPFYIFNVEEQKYTLSITANTTNLSTATPEFCVGQQVNLQATWSPALPSGTQKWAEWTLGGDFIDNFYYPSGYSNPSLIYTNDPNYLTNEFAQVWWISGDYDNPPAYRVNFSEELTFANGQSATLSAVGQIKMFRPSVTGFSVGSPRSFLMLTNDHNQLALAYGNKYTPGDTPPYYGAWWNATINSTYAGSWGLTQVIKALEAVWVGENTIPTFDSLNDAVADAGEFYNITDAGTQSDGSWNYAVTNAASHAIEFQDFPEEPVNTYLWTSVEVNFADSQDYIRFKPAGSGSIYVTLGIVKWNAHGQYNQILGWEHNDTPAPSAPDGSETFPFWTAIKQ
jgi:hypothetical protein